MAAGGPARAANFPNNRGRTIKYAAAEDVAMSTATHELPLPSTRTRPAPSNAILTKAGGLFAGIVLLMVGVIWFLDAMELIDLGPKFGVVIAPFLLMVAGLYLVIAKLVRG